ncbi:hypothetical protein MTO96_040514 [Rhipicephalus appendiculatus]
MCGVRVIVPAKLRNLLLGELHDGDPGIVRSKQLARSYVWWPSIKADLEHRVKAFAWARTPSGRKVFVMRSTTADTTVDRLREVFVRFRFPEIHCH